jgi:hypothetical protein
LHSNFGDKVRIYDILYLRYGIIYKTCTVEFSSEITVSSSFAAECAENAEASEKPCVDWNGLKLCALDDLCGDKSQIRNNLYSGHFLGIACSPITSFLLIKKMLSLRPI